MQEMAPYQRRIIFGMIGLMIIVLSIKLIDRHRRMVGFDMLGFLDGYKYSAALDSSSADLKPPAIVRPEAMIADSLKAPAQASEFLININSANSEQLTMLPGIGPVLAAEIVAHRNANGPFQTADDLLQVKGIGPGKLSQIMEFIEF